MSNLRHILFKMHLSLLLWGHFNTPKHDMTKLNMICWFSCLLGIPWPFKVAKVNLLPLIWRSGSARLGFNYTERFHYEKKQQLREWVIPLLATSHVKGQNYGPTCWHSTRSLSVHTKNCLPTCECEFEFTFAAYCTYKNTKHITLYYSFIHASFSGINFEMSSFCAYNCKMSQFKHLLCYLYVLLWIKYWLVWFENL